MTPDSIVDEDSILITVFYQVCDGELTLIEKKEFVS